MKKFAVGFVFGLLMSVQIGHAQSAVIYQPIQGYCLRGAQKAVTSGASSTNFLQGVIPSCTVTVYVPGTENTPNPVKATIYADANQTPLANPFTANSATSANPGSWTFWYQHLQPVDVVLTGGIAPNTYPQPVTLAGVYSANGTTSFVANIFTGTGLTCLPNVNGVCMGSVELELDIPSLSQAMVASIIPGTGISCSVAGPDGKCHGDATVNNTGVTGILPSPSVTCAVGGDGKCKGDVSLASQVAGSAGPPDPLLCTSGNAGTLMTDTTANTVYICGGDSTWHQVGGGALVTGSGFLTYTNPGAVTVNWNDIPTAAAGSAKVALRFTTCGAGGGGTGGMTVSGTANREGSGGGEGGYAELAGIFTAADFPLTLTVGTGGTPGLSMASAPTDYSTYLGGNGGDTLVSGQTFTMTAFGGQGSGISQPLPNNVNFGLYPGTGGAAGVTTGTVTSMSFIGIAGQNGSGVLSTTTNPNPNVSPGGSGGGRFGGTGGNSTLNPGPPSRNAVQDGHLCGGGAGSSTASGNGGRGGDGFVRIDY